MNELVARKGKKERERLSFTLLLPRVICDVQRTLFCYYFCASLGFHSSSAKGKGWKQARKQTRGGREGVMLQKERKVIVYPFTQRFSILSPRTQPPK